MWQIAALNIIGNDIDTVTDNIQTYKICCAVIGKKFLGERENEENHGQRPTLWNYIHETDTLGMSTTASTLWKKTRKQTRGLGKT